MAMIIEIQNSLRKVACNIGNAYLNAKTREKVYAITGEKIEFMQEK